MGYLVVSARGHAEPALPGPRGRLRHAWPVAAVLALVVVSDFPFRLREQDKAVSGSADPFVLLEIAVYALIALGLFAQCRPRPRLVRPDRLTLAAYALAVVLAATALYSPYPALAMVRAGQVLVVLALFRTIARHGDAGDPHRIAHGYVALLAAAVVFGVLVPFPRLPRQEERFTWLHVHPVQAGEMLAIAVVVLAGYVVAHRLPRHGPRWPMPAYLVLLGICAVGLLATRTRGAVIGAAVGVAVLLWVRWRGAAKLEVIAVGSVFVALIAVSGLDLLEQYFARGESADRLATLNARTDLWALALERFAERPLYGHGLAASRGLFLETIGLGGGHNALVNLLVDAGVVGALAWLAVVAAIGIVARRLLRTNGPARVDGIIVLSVLSGMVANSLFTEGMGAPANVSFSWLYLLLAWVAPARTAEAGDRSRR